MDGWSGWIRMLNNTRRSLRSVCAFLLLTIVSAVAMAGNWQVVETEDYKMSVPADWKVAKGKEVPGPDYTFELQGLLIPVTFNNEATSVSAFIRAMRGATLDEGIRNVISMNRSNSDKYFASDSDQVTRFKLKSGEDAAIIKTRWTRMAKNLQQTKYDLVVYSKKKEYAINFAVFFGYMDKKYTLEEQNHLDARLREVFETFELK